MEHRKILLIVSCGKKKAEKLRDMNLPAIEAYKGPIFQVVEKAKREGRWNSNILIGIISAKYGFLRENHKIEYYDQRMTLRLANIHNHGVIQAITQWDEEENFQIIYVLMGKDYLNAVNGLKEALDTEVIIENMGGLGIGQRKLKNFIDQYSRKIKKTNLLKIEE